MAVLFYLKRQSTPLMRESTFIKIIGNFFSNKFGVIAMITMSNISTGQLFLAKLTKIHQR